MTLEEKYLKSKDNTVIYAQAIGDLSKPHVIFIHGFGLCAMAFSKQFTDKRLSENLYLVAYDMRGHGRSGKPDNPEAYEVARIAQDFAAVVEGFSLNRPFLAGWSIGASIAADVCAIYGPSFLSGLIYLGGHPYVSADMLEKIGTETVGKLVRGFVTDDLSLFSEATLQFVDTCIAEPDKLAFETRLSWQGCVALQSPAVRRCVLGRTQDPRRLLEEGSKSLPLLILHGTMDAHVHGEQLIKVMKAAAFADFDGKLIPQAGHAVFWDQPDVVREEILRFVHRVTHN